MTSLKRSALDDFAVKPARERQPAKDKSEMKALVESAKARGLITGPDCPAPFEPVGTEVAEIEGVKSKWVDVTPEMANAWLDRNFRNRPVSQDTVMSYARDMANGLWVVTHQGIAFNDQNELIDGQHRLRALIEANVIVTMMVTYDLPSGVADHVAMTTMDAVDRGRTRSVADQLKIQHGLKDGTILAAVCATLATLCHNGRTRRLSVGQTLQVYEAFKEPVESVIEGRSKEHGLKQKGVLAAFAFAMPVVPNAALWFREIQLSVPFEHPDKIETSPLWHLRNFLCSDQATLLSRGTDRGLSELCLQAIWLQHRGQRVTELVPGTEGVDEIRAGQSERVAAVGRIFAL